MADEYWTGTIIINVYWREQQVRIEIGNPYGGGLNHFPVTVNNYYFGYFYRANGAMNAYMYALFYSDDLLIMLDLINEKNGEDLQFGKFELNVQWGKRKK